MSKCIIGQRFWFSTHHHFQLTNPSRTTEKKASKPTAIQKRAVSKFVQISEIEVLVQVLSVLKEQQFILLDERRWAKWPWSLTHWTMTGIYYFRVSPLQHDLTAIFNVGIGQMWSKCKTTTHACEKHSNTVCCTLDIAIWWIISILNWGCYYAFSIELLNHQSWDLAFKTKANPSTSWGCPA